MGVQGGVLPLTSTSYTHEKVDGREGIAQSGERSRWVWHSRFRRRLAISSGVAGPTLRKTARYALEDFDPLHETKSGHSRAVPILQGNMQTWLDWAREQSNSCEFVFNQDGEPIKGFRREWTDACNAAGVPDLKFHDLRHI